MALLDQGREAAERGCAHSEALIDKGIARKTVTDMAEEVHEVVAAGERVVGGPSARAA